jgi:hypothetical protein
VLAESEWILSSDFRFINHFTLVQTRACWRSSPERVSLTTWEQLAGIIVRWYALAIVSFAVLWIIWVVSGGNSYSMITNMIAGLSVLVAIIVMVEVLKRKIKSSA